MTVAAILILSINAHCQTSGRWEVARGGIVFGTMAQQPTSTMPFAQKEEFGQMDRIYAKLVPTSGMENWPDGDAGCVMELWMDGTKRAEVVCTFPEPAMFDKAITFPVLPHRHEDSQPRLSNAYSTMMQGTTGSHRITVRVHLLEGRQYVGEGSFRAGKPFGTWK